MIFDSHVHTCFSTDSNMKLTDAINTAGNHSIGLVITDHMDLNYPKEAGFRFNVGDYFKEYGKYRSDNLLLGIEVGMSLDYKEDNENLINSYDFDQVIGSQHTINNIDIGYSDIYEGLSYSEVLNNYFQEICNCIKAHPYIDTLGHIDFISRYAPVSDSEIYYDKYNDLIDSVIKTCINTNTTMEINTRRIKSNVTFDNLKKIYSRYKELGGKYVTIGSDSHHPSAINNNFKEAFLLCHLCNVKPIYFKNRKPEFF